jgi:tRNA G37 N-methylase TrmD|tara:strand:+ start:2384 stop:2581 length:198 start_codon:yes stop_codon:yes gene_type:complete
MSFDLSERVRPHAVTVSACIGDAVLLAGIAACDDVDIAVVSHCSGVRVDRDAGPVFPQDALAESI